MWLLEKVEKPENPCSKDFGQLRRALPEDEPKQNAGALGGTRGDDPKQNAGALGGTRLRGLTLTAGPLGETRLQGK